MAKAKRKKQHVLPKFSPKQLQEMGQGFAGINKIRNEKMQQQIQKVEKRRAYLKEEVSHLYEMSKSFSSHDVKKFIDKKLQEESELVQRFPHAQTIPYHITIGSYQYQDLAIAVILSHVDMVESWSFNSVIELEYEDEYEAISATVNFDLTLPGMTHLEFLRGKRDCRIDLGHGLKRVGWQGFEKEVLKRLESHKELKRDFGIKRIQVDLNAKFKFINTAAYEEFIKVSEWVNSGHEVAERELRDLWIREQLAGSKAKTVGISAVSSEMDG